MPAAIMNLIDDYRIEQGADYEIQITVKNLDGTLYNLVGASCASQIRKSATSPTAVDFTVTINTTTSVISLKLTAIETAAIDFISGVWDCELTELSGLISRLYNGDVEISKEVTKGTV